MVLRQALCMAVPCALLAVCLKAFSQIEVVQQNSFMRQFALFQVLNNSSAYSGFSLVLGFLVVFRTQMAYNRFWEGVSAAQRMSAEWFDSTSSILAFTKVCKADQSMRLKFERKFVKFLSLLHGVAVKSLRDLDDLKLGEGDLEGLCPESAHSLQESPYPATVIFQWVQDIVVQAMEDKVLTVPPPILSRVFNELANGMVAYHDCLKIQGTNVPLPYKQMTKILMGAHWFITPVVMCMWTDWITWTFIMTLVQSMIFWGLYFTAHQIEYPFQTGEISYSVTALHNEFNSNLIEISRAKTGKLQDSGDDLDSRKWVHSIQSFGAEVVTLSRRTPAPSPRPLPCRTRTLDSQESAQIQIQIPFGPQVESGEVCMVKSGADEHKASESMGESKDSVQSEQQPHNDRPSTGTNKGTLSRKEPSIQPRHQLTSTESTAGAVSSLTRFDPICL